MKKMALVALFVVLVASQFGCASSSLSRAALDGNLQEVKVLVSQGEKINEIDKWGWTPLIWSVYYGNFPVTKWLLENGADPNIQTEREYGTYLAGTTALILAAAYGRDDAVEALLENKADSTVVDRKGKKAIDYAEEYGFEKSVALLRKN